MKFPHSLTHKVTLEQCYKCYLYICNSKAFPSKYHQFQQLSRFLCDTPNPWRVVGVTQLAIESIINNENTKGIVRAHLRDRSDWILELIEKQITSMQEFDNFLNNADRTVLAIRSENRKNFKILDYIKFPNDPGVFPINGEMIFFRAKPISYTFEKKELSFLKNLNSKGIL